MFHAVNSFEVVEIFSRFRVLHEYLCAPEKRRFMSENLSIIFCQIKSSKMNLHCLIVLNVGF